MLIAVGKQALNISTILSAPQGEILLQFFFLSTAEELSR